MRSRRLLAGEITASSGRLAPGSSWSACSSFSTQSTRRPLAAAQKIVDKSIKDVQSYFAGQTALALVNGLSMAIGMYFLGVPGALAIGVVNFVGAYIPYIGAFFGGGFAVLMARGDGRFGMAVTAFVIVIFAQVVLENLLLPKLLGSSLNMSPLVILLVTAFGGMVAGMIGLILAAPVAAIGSDLFRELRTVGFFGELPSDATVA